MPDVAASPPPAAPPGRLRGLSGRSREPLFAAVVAACLVFLITLVATGLVRQRLIDTAQERFEMTAGRLTVDLHRELQMCTHIVRGAGGFIGAQDKLPGTDAWERYIAHLALDDAPPCVRTLGYANVSSRELAMGTAAKVVLMWPRRPDGAEQLPIDTRPDTLAALQRAADSGQVALSIHAAQKDEDIDSADRAQRARVDMYLPVYRNAPVPISTTARRAELAGFVLAQVDTEYLFASVAARSPRIDMRVAAGTPAVALYPPTASLTDLPALSDPSGRFQHTDKLRFGGQLVTVHYATDDPLLSAPLGFATGAFIASGLLAALIAGATAFVFSYRRGETLAAAGVARSLSSLNEARMMAIVRASSEAIITLDEAQRIVIFNPMAERIFGCSAMDAIGGTLDPFIPERYREMHRKHVDQFGATGVTERQMGRQRVLMGLRANGEEFPMEASISQISDGDGQRKFYTVMLRDVTERVKGENELKASRQELRELSANLQNVREDEKTRIARELHDDLGQQLTALKMDISSVQQVLGTQDGVPSAVLTQLQGMRRIIDTTVGSVRRIAADLRPVMLDDLGLLPAIEWLLNDFTTRYSIEVARRIEPGDVLFSRNGATALFRIMQEALTNVIRHAEATRVSVEFTVADDRCRLRIADNGRGAAPEDTEGHGEKTFGLLGIRERAHMLGGSVEIHTATGRGFAITVILPLAAIQQEEALP